MNAEPMRNRRDARAWLQCLRHRPCLELIRPAPAKLPRRTLKALGNGFDHMEGSSSRTRRRHRSSQQLIVSATNIRPLTPSARRGLLAAYRSREPTCVHSDDSGARSLRVEQKTKENEKEIRRLWHQRTEDLAAGRETPVRRPTVCSPNCAAIPKNYWAGEGLTVRESPRHLAGRHQPTSKQKLVATIAAKAPSSAPMENLQYDVSRLLRNTKNLLDVMHRLSYNYYHRYGPQRDTNNPDV